MARPMSVRPAHRSAPLSGRSWNNSAPRGTSASGLRAVMNSAWAMLVWLIAVKKIVMLKPNSKPAGRTRRHVASDGAGRPVATRRTAMTIHHRVTAMTIRQKATTAPEVSAHLTIDELLENTRTASSMATRPADAEPGAGVTPALARGTRRARGRRRVRSAPPRAAPSRHR